MTNELTHKEKMDQVIGGLDYLTTKEVDALITTIEAFKDDKPTSRIYKRPEMTFDIRYVSSIIKVNSPEGTCGLTISFRDGTGSCTYFETEDERDRAAEEISNLLERHFADAPPSLEKVSAAALVDELSGRDGVTQNYVGLEDHYALEINYLPGTSVGIRDRGPATILTVID